MVILCQVFINNRLAAIDKKNFRLIAAFGSLHNPHTPLTHKSSGRPPPTRCAELTNSQSSIKSEKHSDRDTSVLQIRQSHSYQITNQLDLTNPNNT